MSGSNLKKPPRKTMVCVTEQRTCERLIRMGAELSGEKDLSVVHVVRNGGAILGSGSDGEALDYLYQISRTYGAEMDMHRSDDVIGTLVEVAKAQEAECIVIGAANKAITTTRFDNTLKARLPGVDIVVVP